MTPARPLLLAAGAWLVLCGARATAGGAQFPRGLLAGDAKTGSCTIETSPVHFGIYDPEAPADKQASGEVFYTCTQSDVLWRLLRVRIEISKGGAGTYARRMSSGTERLFYNVFTDSLTRQVWGDGSEGTDYYFRWLPPSGQRISVPMYGRIPAHQAVAPGDYSDLLQVTMQF
jgi:spore coat protein U-like protein